MRDDDGYDAGDQKKPLWERAGYLAIKLGELIDRRAAAALVPHGLTPREFNVLARIGYREGQSQQELSRVLGIHPPALALSCDKLEKLGYIRRVRDDDDRRRYKLELSASGKEINNAAAAEIDDQESAIFEPLKKNDLVELERLLNKLLGYSN